MAVPTELKLAIAVGGIFFSFSYFAVLQEDVYKKRYGEGEGESNRRRWSLLSSLPHEKERERARARTRGRQCQ